MTHGSRHGVPLMYVPERLHTWVACGGGVPWWGASCSGADGKCCCSPGVFSGNHENGWSRNEVKE